MSVLEVLHYPDPRLHLKANKIENIDSEIKTLVKNMIDTMYEFNGIGLAATQVNVQKRVFVMDLQERDTDSGLKVFINPEILERDGQVIGSEGCLSVPGVYEEVLRAEKIKLKYQDLDGATHIIDCEGLMSVCAQHEIDHLDGKVFVDYLSNLKKTFIKKKMKKIVKPV